MDASRWVIIGTMCERYEKHIRFLSLIDIFHVFKFCLHICIFLLPGCKTDDHCENESQFVNGSRLSQRRCDKSKRECSDDICLPHIPNGYINGSTKSSVIGGVAELRCLPGYVNNINMDRRINVTWLVINGVNVSHVIYRFPYFL